MRKRLLIAPAVAALLALFLSLGTPAWLTRGSPIIASAPDFTQQSSWIYRPETEPPAVWEEGWALDFILLPHTPETLDRHGNLSTATAAMRDRMIADSANLITLLNRHGAVYMPALRVPAASSEDPDYTVARADLVAALAAYFEQDNRGRAVAFVAQDGHARLLGDISALLADAGHQDAADRVLLIFVPIESRLPDQPDLQSMVALPLPAEMAGLHLSHLLFLPNWPQFHGHIPDMEAASEVLESHVADALARAQADARKRVEPFGEMEDVDFIPVMRPNETGVPSAPAADAPPG